MKKFMMTALATAMMSSVAMAADELSVPNTFVQGENAVAAEVNANFQALVDAISDNAEEIAELKLELNTLSVSGKTYQIYQYGVEIARNDNGENTQLRTEKFVVTFNEDETVDVEGTEHSGEVDYDFTEDEWYLDVESDSFSNNSGLSWSRNGNVVTIADSVDDDGGATFLIAPGARTLIDMETFTDDDSYFEGEVLWGVQILPE